MNTNEKLEIISNALKTLRASIADENKYISLNDIDEFVKTYLDIIEK